jgi:DNA-binding response OmpR family regulator
MRVLIVEDDMAVAGALSPLVTEAGHDLVGLAADRDTAIALIAQASVTLALIDLHLADGWTGADVARAAAENGVAAVFTTANPSMLPSDLAGACAVMSKPYTPRQVTACLRYIAARIDGEDADAPPRGLDLGPQWMAAAARADASSPDRVAV